MPRLIAFYTINLLLVLFIDVKTASNGTKTKGLPQCSCTLDGHLYNLLPLARNDGKPRFQTEKQGWNYAFNPCYPFSILPPSACEEVAVCRWDEYDQSFTNLGFQKDAQCQISAQGRVELVFKIPMSQHWITTIILKCNQSRKGLHDGQLTVVHDTSNPVLQLEHICCCPDGCPEYVIPTHQPTPVHSTKTYSMIAVEIIGGSLGFLLIVLAAGIFIYRRRRNPKVNRRHEENRRIIGDDRRGPDYRAIANRDPDEDEAPDVEGLGPGPEAEVPDPEGEAPDPEGVVPDPEGEAPDPEGEAPDPEGEAPDPEGEAPDPEGEAPDPEGEAPDPEGEAPDPEGEAPDPEGEPPDPEGEAPDPEGEAPHPEGEAHDLENEAPGPEGDDSDSHVEASEPEGEQPQPPEGDVSEPEGVAPDPIIEASDSHGEATDSDCGAPDADDEASDPSSQDSNPNGEVSDPGFEASTSDDDASVSADSLPFPVPVESGSEHQCCEVEPPRRVPVEHSL